MMCSGVAEGYWWVKRHSCTFYKKIGKLAAAPVPLISQVRGESTKKGTQWCVDSIWKRGLWSGRPNIAAGAESRGPVAWISLSESKQRDAGFATSMNWQEVKANVKEERSRWGGGRCYLCARTFYLERRQAALFEGWERFYSRDEVLEATLSMTDL